VGYAIVALSTVHAGTVMSAMKRASQTGILAATGAFFLLLFEIVLGLSLKDDETSARRPLRRLHFWTMAAFVLALGVHLLLNA
jgi:drug/metabolite transporter (DMT)-like permease